MYYLGVNLERTCTLPREATGQWGVIGYSFVFKISTLVEVGFCDVSLYILSLLWKLNECKLTSNETHTHTQLCVGVVSFNLQIVNNYRYLVV